LKVDNLSRQWIFAGAEFQDVGAETEVEMLVGLARWTDCNPLLHAKFGATN